MSGTHCVLRAPASRIISSVNFPARSSFLTAPSLAVASGYRPCQPPAPAKGVVARDRSAIVARGYASKRGSDLPGLPPGLDAGQRESIARAVEQAQSATETWSVRVTGFLTPPVYTIAAQVLQPLSDVAAFPWGGYPQAERCRLLVGREEQILPLTEEPFTITDVAAMQISGNFMFDVPSHPDFLGSILGTGITREKVGDIILLGDQGAQFLTAPELVSHFESSLTQVRTVTVTTRQIDLSQLSISAPKVVETKSVEASMRLDSVASAGFRMSRSKMSDLIKSGAVRVNWKTGCKSKDEVKEGDIISCSGKGRVEVKAVSVTKKGKYGVELVRYI